MRALDRYILGEIIRPLFAAILLGLLVLLTERMLRVLDLVFGVHDSLKFMLKILAFLVPHYIGLALPLALFLGIWFGLRRLVSDSEMDAVQAAGIGLTRVLVPVMVATVAMTAIAAVSLSYLQPYARHAYRAIIFEITNASLQLLLRPGAFHTIADVTFLVGDTSGNGRQFDKVFLYREPAGEDWVAISARSGKLVRSGGTGQPALHLFDGLQMSGAQTRETGPPEKPPASIAIRFEEMFAVLDGLERSVERRQRRHEREFTLTELWRQRFDPPAGLKTADLVAEFYNRIVHILSIPLLAFLAIPLAAMARPRQRSYGLPVGIIVLLVYEQVLDFGKNLVESSVTTPLFGQWLPLGLFALASLALFVRAARRVPSGRGLPSIDLAGWFRRRPREGEP
jgi:lipopolysaccharide export system permease protein